MKVWSNWSGSIKFMPGKIVTPESEEALAEIISKAAREKTTVRAVGKGHSSSPLVETNQVLVSLEKLKGIESYNTSLSEATLRTGMTVHDAGEELFKIGLATHNTGDVDVQSLAGAIGTGTHGSGKTLKNLSSMLIGVRMVTANGEIKEYAIENEPEMFKAFRVSLGSLGIFTSIRLKLLPAFQLERKEWCTTVDPCMQQLEQLQDENRNFDFYWYPRSDEIKLRTLNTPGKGSQKIINATCVEQETGWSGAILPKTRVLKFEEMEYAIPAESGPECFLAVRKRILEQHRKEVAWRVLYRTVRSDDAYLSTASEKDIVTISLHHNAGLPYDVFFNDIEPIFLAFGGRPHWGKKHNLKAQELKTLYPGWNTFLKIRKQMDPENLFMNPYLKKLLIE